MVLFVGRDRALAPPLGWWNGPVWLGRGVTAAVVTAWSLWQAAEWQRIAPVPVTALLVVLQLAPAMLARSRPLTAARVALVAAAAAIAVLAWTDPAVGPAPSWPLDAYLVPFAPVFALAIARTANRWTIAAPVLLVPTAGAVVFSFSVGAGVMVGPVAGSALTVAAGFALHRQRRAAEQATASATTERERRIVLEERTRIARELHDVVGHHLSLIAVRTDSAPYRIAGVDDAVRQELAELGMAARQALAETRQLVAVLRQDETEYQPAPGLDDIRALAEEAGATLAIGSLPELRDTTRLALHRIVQESLTNARKHSPGAPIAVTLRLVDRSIRVTVHNGPGHGLIGIRERVTALGGRSAAGPLPDGGYQVTAEVPA